ncbi:centromere protein P-like [Saccostrea echinata]|uniref:centromere protein P-like n=1 Tax=Saccostrea echinata TaxID=191078 RepID=UPI002A7FE297|nr:centromere protein P-like [Saccostrea echinata]
MAGSLQLEKDVQQQIETFGEGDLALGRTLSVLSRSVQRKSLTNGLAEVVSQLEQEIAELRNTIKQKTVAVSKRSQDLYELQYVKRRQKPEEIQAEVERLQSQIERTKDITGLSIEKYRKQEISKERHASFSIEGNVLGNEFSVQFDAKKTEEDHVTIENLGLSVGDDVLQRLHQPLLQLSDNNAVGPFFSLMEQYSRWVLQRQETFQHFSEKYPDTVSSDSDDSSVLVLQSPHISNSPSLCVCWTFMVDPLCQFHPELKLEVIVHKKLLEADKDNVMKKAPEVFQKMLDSYGIERALETVIQLIRGT